MGSIGQYSGEMDFIENAYLENITLLNGQVSFPSPICATKPVLIKAEWSSPEGVGRSRRRIRSHQQYHVSQRADPEHG